MARTAKGRAVRYLLLLAGTALLVGLVVHFGVGTFFDFFRQLGWRVLLMVVLAGGIMHGAWLAGWWLAFTGQERPPAKSLARCYLPGEAMNVLTGLAHMGGEPMKAWLLAPEVGWSRSLASVISARTLRIIAQLVFVVGGFTAALVVLELPAAWRASLFLGSLLVSTGVAAFFYLQRRHLLSRAIGFLARRGLTWTERYLEKAAEVDQSLKASYEGRTPRVLLSIAVQYLGFCAGIAEILLLCHFVGVELSLGQAFLAETLAYAITTVVFFVPAGLGVIEGGRVLVFQLIGLDPALGLMAGLLRRCRELGWASLGLAVYGLSDTPAGDAPGGGHGPGPA